MVPFQDMVYVEDRDQYVPEDEVRRARRVLDISGTELRRRLQEGLEIPEWFSFPEVVEELRRTHPPRHQQGFTVFFTGLSGSGKSTIANALLVKLLEMGGRPVTLLDGDHGAQAPVQRARLLARSTATSTSGASATSPARSPRTAASRSAPRSRPTTRPARKVREMIEPLGGFILVHVATSLEVCESRDRKGLYAKARAGIIKEFTGISDPYEAPENPAQRSVQGQCLRRYSSRRPGGAPRPCTRSPTARCPAAARTAPPCRRPSTGSAPGPAAPC